MNRENKYIKEFEKKFVDTLSHCGNERDGFYSPLKTMDADAIEAFILKALKSQRKEIIEKIKKGFIKTADNYILNSKIEPKLVLSKHQFWKMIKETLIKEDE